MVVIHLPKRKADAIYEVLDRLLEGEWQLKGVSQSHISGNIYQLRILYDIAKVKEIGK